MSETRCESCSMPIESGTYCHHCTTADGELQSFDETLERFKQWTRREEAGLDDEGVTRKTLDFMATMPAWRDHPRLGELRG